MQPWKKYALTAAGLAVGLAVTLAPQAEPVRAEEDAAGPALAKYTETIPGTSAKFEMIPIPGGTYTRGSPKSEAGRTADEGPAHPVALKPFWIGKCEVTWDEYDPYWQTEGEARDEKQLKLEKELADKADAITRPTPPYTDMTFGYGHDGYPAICMTHHAAVNYCRWLSLKTGKTYRLPTEAEWEYACRAGTKTAYYWGDDAKQVGDHAWFKDNAEESPQPVGKKKPNAWGLHDMAGNVMEWCLDSYEKDTYAKHGMDKPTLNPFQAPIARRFPDVARGGSWADEPARLRSAARVGSTKEWIKLDPQRPQSIWWLTSAEFVGFRVVRSADDKDSLAAVRSPLTKESK